MKIINKTLSGKVSFRGLGFVKVNGMHIAICGSRQIECGIGSELAWLDTQMELVPVEPELKATFNGAINTTVDSTGQTYFQTLDKKRSLYIGALEGLMLGADQSGDKFILIPPLRQTFLPGLPRDTVYLDGFYNAYDAAVDSEFEASSVYVNLAE